MDSERLRTELTRMLGIPAGRAPLDAETRGSFEWDGVTVEKWVYSAEPGSRVPALLYRPTDPRAPLPATVLTFGHGGSKSHVSYNYVAQLYARAGLACLAADPIGEEERHIAGGMGTRAHDPEPVSSAADAAGRLIMGKLVFDTMRGVDLLLERDDVDGTRVGVAGNSLGGAKASWMAALDTRLRLAIISGWAYDDIIRDSKLCTRLPAERMRARCTFGEFLALAAPRCAVLVMNGAADTVIDKDGDGRAWRGTREAVEGAGRVYATYGVPERLGCWFLPGGGHRPYMARKEALSWINRHLGTPNWTPEEIRALRTVNLGAWADAHGITFERLYGTPLHLRGATPASPTPPIRPIPRELLACLRPGELGAPEYTLEGWLDTLKDEG